MATYTTHHDTARVDPTAPAQEHNDPQRTAPMLIAALALALLALGVWWYVQRQDSVPATTMPVTTAPMAIPADVPATPDERAATHRTGARAAERTPAVVAYRAPRPLAGNPLPEYPRAALRSGEESSVLLSIAVDARGTPTDVRVIQRSGSRDRSFDRAAIEAARQWQFTPAMRDGKAVSATVQLPVDFRRS
jgi:protein TonB